MSVWFHSSPSSRTVMTTPFPVMPFCHTGITCRSSFGSEEDVRVSCWKTNVHICDSDCVNDLRGLHLIVCVKKVSQSTARCADLLQKLITGIVGYFLLSTLMATCFLADCLQRVIKILALVIIITLKMPGNVLRFKPQFLLARLTLKSPCWII